MALPYNPLEKPQKRTAAERRSERKARDHNPLKPAFDKKPRSNGLKPVSDKREKLLKANGWDGRSTFFVSSDGEKRLKRTAKVRRSAKPWRNLSARHDWAKTPKARVRLKQVGERAKRLAAPLAEWRRKVKAVWGGCIITGEDRPGRVECHHMYDRAIRPQWVTEVWNGIPLETRTIHPLADTYPELHKALIAVADECRAAADGRRPPVSRAEAREVIFRMAPKVKKYVAQESEG